MLVPVNLTRHQYVVKIDQGIAMRAGKEISKVWSMRQIAIITDDNVAPLYLKELKDQLERTGYQCYECVVPHGELSKSLSIVQNIIQNLANHSFTRDDGVIALGGGVIGDLAGLIASLYMRGISYIQIPTSLTAQVDSSVGGKTAVDMGEIKNIIGTFYQPDLVLVDPDYLKTLPQRDLVEGYAEVVKTSVLCDSNFFALTNRINSVSDLRNHVTQLIVRSIEYKSKIVMEDEKESGVRKFLNFGHTFGHPIESLSHGSMRHGEAVSIGMITISQIFEKLAISPTGLTVELKKRLESVGLPTESPLIGTPEFFELLKNDKKNRSGILNMVAIKEVGEPVIVLKEVTQIPEMMKCIM